MNKNSLRQEELLKIFRGNGAEEANSDIKLILEKIYALISNPKELELLSRGWLREKQKKISENLENFPPQLIGAFAQMWGETLLENT